MKRFYTQNLININKEGKNMKKYIYAVRYETLDNHDIIFCTHDIVLAQDYIKEHLGEPDVCLYIEKVELR